jgi:hypothetical protein
MFAEGISYFIGEGGVITRPADGTGVAAEGVGCLGILLSKLGLRGVDGRSGRGGGPSDGGVDGLLPFLDIIRGSIVRLRK